WSNTFYVFACILLKNTLNVRSPPYAVTSLINTTGSSALISNTLAVISCPQSISPSRLQMPFSFVCHNKNPVSSRELRRCTHLPDLLLSVTDTPTLKCRQILNTKVEITEPLLAQSGCS